MNELAATEAILAAVPQAAWRSHLIPAAALLDVLEQWSASLRRCGQLGDAEAVAAVRRRFLERRAEPLLQPPVAPPLPAPSPVAPARLRRRSTLRTRRRS